MEYPSTTKTNGKKLNADLAFSVPSKTVWAQEDSFKVTSFKKDKVIPFTDIVGFAIQPVVPPAGPSSAARLIGQSFPKAMAWSDLKIQLTDGTELWLYGLSQIKTREVLDKIVQMYPTIQISELPTQTKTLYIAGIRIPTVGNVALTVLSLVIALILLWNLRFLF